MLAANPRELPIKYTTVLPQSCITDLKELADSKIVASVSQGIRLAIEAFVADQKQQAYVRELELSMTDAAFAKRTLDSQYDFSHVDSEGAW